MSSMLAAGLLLRRKGFQSLQILSLNTNPGFEDIELWRAHSTVITALDPLWPQKSLIAKIRCLLRVSKNFDIVLFHYDARLAALYGLIRAISHSKRGLVFQGLFCDISSYSLARLNMRTVFRNCASFLFYCLLVRTMNAVIVHTSAEVDLYSKCFSVTKSRFIFVPYFHYAKTQDFTCIGASIQTPTSREANILAIGRHRDFDCFTQALTESPWQGVIVAGDSDRQELDGKVPANVTVHYEVSRTEYLNHIAKSTIVVIPLCPNRWQRALGQIAMFEAIRMQKPVIAAETFQLRDYASNNEVLYYRPGDAKHLREQIVRLVDDTDLQSRLAKNARTRLLAEFTRERYVAQLIAVCQSCSQS